MATECTDKPTPMTIEQCNCRRRTTRWWVGGITVVVLGISATYVVPAISAGYKAQNAIENHLIVQEEFEKRMKERADQRDALMESKFKTLRDYRAEDKKMYLELLSRILDEQAAARDDQQATREQVMVLQGMIDSGSASTP